MHVYVYIHTHITLAYNIHSHTYAFAGMHIYIHTHTYKHTYIHTYNTVQTNAPEFIEGLQMPHSTDIVVMTAEFYNVSSSYVWLKCVVIIHTF